MKPHLQLWLMLLVGVAPAQEWTRFRGPNGGGHSDAKTIPTKWSEADFNWKVALPGAGHSSPVLWGDKVFVTSCDARSGQFYILGFNTSDGSKLWQKESVLTPYRKHNNNTLASATPTVDAERVYVSRTERAQQTLLALNHAGEMIWERSLGPFTAQHGGGTSPILHEGKVILANEHDGESFLIAVDARSGETRWQIPRKNAEAGYSTPCVFQPTGQPPALIFNHGDLGIAALAPDTGRVLWQFPDAFNQRSVSSPVIVGDLVIGSCGNGGGANYVIAIRPGDTNRAPQQAYAVRRSAPYVPTSICVGDWLYLWSDGGIVSRVHAATGEVKWQERAGGNFLSSPVCVDGRLFGISTSGEVVVLGTGENFEVLARNPLNETTHSTPAIAGGRMFIHTSGHLVCVGGKTATTASP